MNQNVVDIGAVTVEQVEKALFDVIQGTSLMLTKSRGCKGVIGTFRSQGAHSRRQH